MRNYVTVKKYGKHQPGATVRLPSNTARTLIALGLVAEAPPPTPAALLAKAPKRAYKRRDMVAETPLEVEAEKVAAQFEHGEPSNKL